jgi:S-adenosylmethionine uptake transporter
MRSIVRPAMTPNLAGALLMIASMACFTVNDALLKSTGGAVPLFQLLFLRGVLAAVLIALLAWSRGSFGRPISRRDWRLIALRSASEVGAAYFFVTALLNMPLANITAILQVLPLTVTLGSALFFGESVGWRRMLAIGIGFCGMLLIVRPGPEGFSLWSVYALIAVVCVTARDLSTRRLSREVPSLVVTLSAAVAVLVTSGIASLTISWAPVDGQMALIIGAAALFVVGGYFFSVQVMRSGDVSFIAPFRYTGLIWALLLGWLVFGEWPRPLTLLGAGIIVATGLFALYRERALLRG